MSDEKPDELPKAYEPKTNNELEALAQDWTSGRIFTSLDLHAAGADDMVHSVFMPMSFVDAQYIDWMKSQKISVIYESMDMAGPRSVNGFPSFMSMKMLNIDDANKVITRRNEIMKFLSGRFDPEPGNEPTV